MFVSEYFTPKEFACPCCGVSLMDDNFVNKLSFARSRSSCPFIICSGFRCQLHNDSLLNSVPDSSHLSGLAVDIKATNSIWRFQILSSLFSIGFNRIGIGTNFIHVDLDLSKPSHVVWGY